MSYTNYDCLLYCYLHVYILESNELVVIIFGVCFEYPSKHQQAYTFEEVAIKVSELYSDPGKVFFGNAYCHDTCKYNTHYFTILSIDLK